MGFLFLPRTIRLASVSNQRPHLEGLIMEVLLLDLMFYGESPWKSNEKRAVHVLHRLLHFRFSEVTGFDWGARIWASKRFGLHRLWD